VAGEIIGWVIAAPFVLLAGIAMLFGAFRIVLWVFSCIDFWIRMIGWLRGSGDRPRVLD
jgi:hypothetical protein